MIALNCQSFPEVHAPYCFTTRLFAVSPPQPLAAHRAGTARPSSSSRDLHRASTVLRDTHPSRVPETPRQGSSAAPAPRIVPSEYDRTASDELRASPVQARATDCAPVQW